MLGLQEMMQIYVTEPLIGRTITLEVDSHDTIGNAKDKIQYMEGFPKANSAFVYVLNDRSLKTQFHSHSCEIYNPDNSLWQLNPWSTVNY